MGIPREVFPALSAQNYLVDWSVDAEGFVSRRLAATFAAQPAFPAAFTPADLGGVMLHRIPTVIEGSTLLAVGNDLTPIPAATVQVTGIWRVAPAANVAVPAAAPDLVSLTPPLYFDRAIATAQLARRNLTPILGDDKQLVTQHLPGENILRVSNRQNILVNDILSIDPQEPERIEYVTIAVISGAIPPTNPHSSTLTHPLANLHRQDVIVRRVTPGIAGPNFNLSDHAARRQLHFPKYACGLVPGESSAYIRRGRTRRISQRDCFAVQSDAFGFYRLPLLHRVAQSQLVADDGGAHPAVTRIYRPDYRSNQNRVDMILR